jgi:hypothetical protein
MAKAPKDDTPSDTPVVPEIVIEDSVGKPRPATEPVTTTEINGIKIEDF